MDWQMAKENLSLLRKVLWPRSYKVWTSSVL